jgi:hypothetical protein
MKTLSEKLFEKFCDDHGIACQRIEEGIGKTPDYELSLSGTSAIAEVKEIERNEAEKESDRLLNERGYGEVLSNVPGGRARSKITKASPQIKRRTKGKKPGILVLYDRGRAHGHLDPYNIRVAMSGLEQVHFAVPRDPRQSPYTTGMSHGSKRKMTENVNTSISAIAVMNGGESDAIRIDIYHNKHASVPLDPALIAGYGIIQAWRVGPR